MSEANMGYLRSSIKKELIEILGKYKSKAGNRSQMDFVSPQETDEHCQLWFAVSGPTWVQAVKIINCIPHLCSCKSREALLDPSAGWEDFPPGVSVAWTSSVSIAQK